MAISDAASSSEASGRSWLDRLNQRSTASWAMALIVAVAAVLLCWDLSEPFVGKLEGWNGALFSTIARNYNRYGFTATHLGMVTNGDAARPDQFIYYTTHPPLLPIAVSLSFRLFGEHEWAARLVPVAFSLASVLLIYRLGTELGDRRLGLLSALIFALLPVNAFYGRMVNHEALVLCMSLATVLAYWRWHRTRRWRWLALALGALAVGMEVDWPAYYLAGVLPVHHFLASGRGRRDWRVAWFPVLALAVFAIHLAHTRGFMTEDGQGWAELLLAFRLRTSSTLGDLTTNASDTFTWLAFLKRWAGHSVILFTPPVLLLSAYTLYQVARGQGARLFSHWLLPTLLLIIGLGHLPLFRQGAWVHEYAGFYCGAPLALLAAAGMLYLSRGPKSSWIVAILMLLFAVSALPKLRVLHASDRPVHVEFARFVGEHSRPGEVIATNERLLMPQVGYYARRDALLEPIKTGPELETMLSKRGRVAFFLSTEGPGVSELARRLAARGTVDSASFAGKAYRVFHVAGDKASARAGTSPLDG